MYFPLEHSTGWRGENGLICISQVAVLCLNACLPSSTHFIESMMCISPFAETERLQYVAVASTRGAVILFSIAVLQDYNTDA